MERCCQRSLITRTCPCLAQVSVCARSGQQCKAKASNAKQILSGLRVQANDASARLENHHGSLPSEHAPQHQLQLPRKHTSSDETSVLKPAKPGLAGSVAVEAGPPRAPGAQAKRRRGAAVGVPVDTRKNIRSTRRVTSCVEC